MKIINTKFKGLKILKDINYYDERGYFREILKKNYFTKKNFIFWCMSKSKKNVIRGLHLQNKVQLAYFKSKQKCNLTLYLSL